MPSEVTPPTTGMRGDAGAEDRGLWVTVTEAAARAGVSRRTVRRWIAADQVVSRLVEEEGREFRLIHGDSLPPVTGDVIRDDTGDDPGDVPGVRVKQRDSRVTGDDTGDDTGDRGDSAMEQLVTSQAQEITFLRQQLQAQQDARRQEIERRDHAEAELRRLLLVSQQSLATAIEPQKALPPVVAPPRARWYWPFGRR
jgi:hypothetical protein